MVPSSSSRPAIGSRGRSRRAGGSDDVHVDELPGRYALALALELQRLDGHAHGPIPDERSGRRADQDLIAPGSLLEPAAVSTASPVTPRPPWAPLARDDGARIHADADRELNPPLGVELDVQVADAGDEVQCGAARSEGVVLMRDRNPEGTEDRVADELLDCSPVTVESAFACRVVAQLNSAKCLRIEVFAERGGSTRSQKSRLTTLRTSDAATLPSMRVPHSGQTRRLRHRGCASGARAHLAHSRPRRGSSAVAAAASSTVRAPAVRDRRADSLIRRRRRSLRYGHRARANSRNPAPLASSSRQRVQGPAGVTGWCVDFTFSRDGRYLVVPPTRGSV